MITNRHLFWSAFAAVVVAALWAWSLLVRFYGDPKQVP